VGKGFKVNPSQLQVGSQDVQYLQGRCEAIAQYAQTALASMAGSAGHEDLASALHEAAERGNTAFTGLLAAYGHASNSLFTAGQAYVGADNSAANAAAGVLGGWTAGGPQALPEPER